MTTPPGVPIGELAPLLYRARWLRFTVSGEVRSSRRRAGLRGDEQEELNGTVLAAPRGHYRADLFDEDGDPALTIREGQSGRVPFPRLLIPSWLLADYDLVVIGDTEHLGRAAYAVAGTPRAATTTRAGQSSDRVSAVVDAELGVLLRYEKFAQGRQAETARFTSLTASPGDAAHAAGPEVAEWGDDQADLASGQVNLLHRSGLPAQTFTAELRQWSDQETMRRLSQAELRAADPGRFTRWLLEHAPDSQPGPADLAACLTIALPGRYRIEALTDTGTAPSCLSCDGDRLWRVYPDRIAVRPAEPLPAGIRPVIDPAWLLNGYRLSAVDNTTLSGRPALRVVSDDLATMRRAPLSGFPFIADSIESIIDAELGIVLGQAFYYQGHPVLRTELAGLTTDVDPAVFRVAPPPGTRVITGGLLAEAGVTPAGAARMTARATAKLAAEISKRWTSRPRP